MVGGRVRRSRRSHFGKFGADALLSHQRVSGASLLQYATLQPVCHHRLSLQDLNTALCLWQMLQMHGKRDCLRYVSARLARR